MLFLLVFLLRLSSATCHFPQLVHKALLCYCDSIFTPFKLSLAAAAAEVARRNNCLAFPFQVGQRNPRNNITNNSILVVFQFPLFPLFLLLLFSPSSTRKLICIIPLSSGSSGSDTEVELFFSPMRKVETQKK